MGHIGARVVSSETVSLSLVSSIFKQFLSSDNGTSPEVFACLKRSSAAVDELIQAKALKSKGNAERDECTGHRTLERKASSDGHGESEGKKQLGLEGVTVDAKRGRREHEGYQQNVQEVHHILDHNMATNELEKELKEKHMKEPSKRDKRYQQVQEVAQVDDPTADTVNDQTEKKKKRKKNVGEGEDGRQEDELHRDKKKRRKQNQELQQ